MLAPLLRGKQMPFVRNGIVFKKKTKSRAWENCTGALPSKCGEIMVAQKETPHSKAFGVYGKKQMKCVNKIWPLLDR